MYFLGIDHIQQGIADRRRRPGDCGRLVAAHVADAASTLVRAGSARVVGGGLSEHQVRFGKIRYRRGKDRSGRSNGSNARACPVG